MRHSSDIFAEAVRRGCILGALAWSLVACGTAPSVPPLPDGVRPLDYAGWSEYGRAAYRAGELDNAIEAFEVLLNEAPAHATLVRNLALLHLEAENDDAAVSYLERYGRLGLLLDLSDRTFDPLRERSGFAELEALFAAAAEVRAESAVVAEVTPSLRLVESAVPLPPVPEGPGGWAAGAVVTPGLFHVTETGDARPLVAGVDLASVFGLALNADRTTLWAASAVVPQTPPDARDSFAGVTAIDLARRTVLAQIAAPAGRAVQDIAVDVCGTLYASDGLNGGVYRLGADESWEQLVDRETLRSPQGLAPDRARNLLYIADYIHGLAVMDLETGNVTNLRLPEEVTTVGADGLTRVGRDLFVIQNGVRPNRLLKLTLSEEGHRAIAAKVIDRLHPEHLEPTLGSYADGQFTYVANSRWPAYGEGGALELPNAVDAPTRILGLAVQVPDPVRITCR